MVLVLLVMNGKVVIKKRKEKKRLSRKNTWRRGEENMKQGTNSLTNRLLFYCREKSKKGLGKLSEEGWQRPRALTPLLKSTRTGKVDLRPRGAIKSYLGSGKGLKTKQRRGGKEIGNGTLSRCRSRSKIVTKRA